MGAVMVSVYLARVMEEVRELECTVLLNGGEARCWGHVSQQGLQHDADVLLHDGGVTSGNTT